MKPYYQDAQVTIYHGDCREVLSALPAGSVDCIIADPPFNAGKEYGVGTDDARPWTEYWHWLGEVFVGISAVMRPGAALWAMNETRNLARMQLILEDQAMLEFQNLVVWAFGNPTPAAKRLAKTWRGIIFMRKPGDSNTWNLEADHLRRETLYCNFSRMEGGRTIPDLWPDIPKLVGGYLAQEEVITTRNGAFAHLAQMPQALAERPVLLTTNPGDLVLDPCMGSGTTLRAAKDLGRKAIGIEIEERYCEIAVKRLAQEVLSLDGMVNTSYTIHYGTATREQSPQPSFPGALGET
mgnify:CR=1 FL=1